MHSVPIKLDYLWEVELVQSIVIGKCVNVEFFKFGWECEISMFSSDECNIGKLSLYCMFLLYIYYVNWITNYLHNE